MTTKWDKQTFTECVQPIRVDRGKQVKAREYLSSGKYPVVDQGQGLVAGWTDSEAAVIRDGLPYVVFGDHTRLLKYVDFPFALGADGTKLLKPKDDINPLYFYFHLLCLDIPSRGYSRHYRLLKEREISLPPLPEQKKIAAVLLKIQRAIETQDKIIQSLRDLKKSTMQHLFTHGLRGEKTKMTDIGEIPESWDVVPLGVMADIKHGYAFKSQYFANEGDYILLTPGSFYEEGGFRDEPEKRKYYSGPVPPDFILNRGDLLIAMTEQARGLLGSSLIVPESGRYLHNQRLGLVQIRDRERLHAGFVSHLFNTSRMRQSIALSATGMKVRHTAPSRVLELQVPVPSGDEQAGIVSALDLLNSDQRGSESKKAALQDLFKTTLNKLMTGDIRVGDLDIDVKEVEV